MYIDSIGSAHSSGCVVNGYGCECVSAGTDCHSSGCVVNGSNAMACSYAYYECHMFIIPLLTETPVKFVLK